MLDKEILLLPGPTPIPPRVIQAMAAPLINHRGPKFKAILDEVTAGVKRVFQTENDILFLTSSGTGAMEAAVTNFISPGEKALVLSVGAFGERFFKICQKYRVDAELMDVPWGAAIEPGAVDARLAADRDKEIKAILVQHNETSTGVVNDIAAISRARGDHPALLIVDAISGLAAANLQTDAWKVDVALGGAQKAFMVPPGLAMVAVSSHAWERAQLCENGRFYFDLTAARDFQAKGQTPYTPAISVFYGLQEALRMLAEEGLDGVFKRHALYRRIVRAGVKAMGLELLAADDIASPAVTAVRVPSGRKPGEITGPMRERFGVVIAGGQGRLADQTFRIGHLGYVQPVDLLGALGALEVVLKDFGMPANGGVRVAQQVLEEAKDV